MPADFAIDDGLAALSDLAKRWRVPKRRLKYAVDSRDIRPTAVVGGTAAYDVAAQEEIARALEETSASPKGWRRRGDAAPDAWGTAPHQPSREGPISVSSSSAALKSKAGTRSA